MTRPAALRDPSAPRAAPAPEELVDALRAAQALKDMQEAASQFQRALPSAGSSASSS